MRKVRDVKQKKEANPVDREFGKFGDTEATEEDNEDTCDEDEGNEDNARNGKCCVAHFLFFVLTKLRCVVDKLFHLLMDFLSCRFCKVFNHCVPCSISLISRERKRWFTFI